MEVLKFIETVDFTKTDTTVSFFESTVRVYSRLEVRGL